MRRLIPMLAVAAAAWASAASAHTVGPEGGVNLFHGGNWCVDGSAFAYHSNSVWGDTHTHVKAQKSSPFWPQYGCIFDYERPAGYLAVSWNWYEWRTDRWELCNYSGWHYNASTSHVFTVYKTFTSNHTCGSGYYTNYGGAFAYNGGWQGGWIYPGYHWYPA